MFLPVRQSSRISFCLGSSNCCFCSCWELEVVVIVVLFLLGGGTGSSSSCGLVVVGVVVSSLMRLFLNDDVSIMIMICLMCNF